MLKSRNKQISLQINGLNNKTLENVVESGESKTDLFADQWFKYRTHKRQKGNDKQISLQINGLNIKL